MLHIIHLVLAVLRHIHRELYILGPGIVPIVLSKYRAACATLIALLCGMVALYDFARRCWLQGALWIASAALLVAGFESAPMLWSPVTTITLASLAMGTALFAVLLTFYEMLQDSLARARHERRQLRRIPGSPERELQPGQRRSHERR